MDDIPKMAQDGIPESAQKFLACMLKDDPDERCSMQDAVQLAQEALKKVGEPEHFLENRDSRRAPPCLSICQGVCVDKCMVGRNILKIITSRKNV